MVSDLVARLFANDVTQMVSQLLDGREVSLEELARLKSLIREKEAETRWQLTLTWLPPRC